LKFLQQVELCLQGHDILWGSAASIFNVNSPW